MKKSLLVAALFALGLVACGKKEEAPVASAVVEASAPVASEVASAPAASEVAVASDASAASAAQ
ncbi:hypothetical protein [Chitinilyticum piscinae]|uniref:Lipoprotein n=1 Tax=Chitinilyticum piscinae TaxID=2866724 RepID=A0A8J7KB33_9NEIS|nr:hypothetical protein [Chitinilyticum piscinae]MBE9609784.1 hypothetical protein [Chitinilyticum piscinae]